MKTIVCETKEDLGRQAADQGAEFICQAIETQGSCRIIVATGASQFEMLRALVAHKDIDWTKVTGFHLDEYIGIADTHPASFRGYLRQRFVSQVPLSEFHYINGEGDARAECRRVGRLLAAGPIDVAFVGIGENGHLAFNDPPADFETAQPYIVVKLDEACRRQQLGEGWFKTLADVPSAAISMSIRQILKSAAIICTVPDRRKAAAVKACLQGPVSNLAPASILQQHSQTFMYLDKESSSLLQ